VGFSECGTLGQMKSGILRLFGKDSETGNKIRTREPEMSSPTSDSK